MNVRTRHQWLERVLKELTPDRSYADVARALGCSRSWVSELLSSEDLGARAAAARKLAHARRCENCDRDFRARAGLTPEPRCRRCQQRTETRERVEADLRALATRLNRTPCVSDAPKLVRRAQHSHGSWSTALVAAGIDRRRPGRPRTAIPIDRAADR